MALFSNQKLTELFTKKKDQNKDKKKGQDDKKRGGKSRER